MGRRRLSVLIDTHVFVWALFSPSLLTATAQQSLRRHDFAFVSSVSLYEIASKVRLGKWPEAEPLLLKSIDFFQEQGFRFISVTPELALRAGRLVGEHRDPFDRFIVSTAIELNLDLISKDVRLDPFGVRRIW